MEEAEMDNPDGLILDQGRAIYRPLGNVSFDDAAALVRGAITAARSQQIAELLVDTTALYGFASPDTFQRFIAVVDWAHAAEGCLRLAMVARAELIDPQKFGVTVGLNRNLVNNIFSTEAEARAWLDAHCQPGQ
jgi:hypothetical protein